ncbi:single-stranded DNA-binding protein [Chloroflexales bacterium ZM16-3]|nr:single-stranded DNA-binding protein [Chloroflexales bacterium ZM16-3]
MAKDLNKVQMTGYLGADPEMRYTSTGSAVTNFRVASSRTWKDKEGTQHDDTEWFRIVAWDKLGEICNQYLTKGTRVYVEGRLQTRKYTDRDGVDRYTSEVIAQDMIILSPRGERGPVPDAEESYEEPGDAHGAPSAPARRSPTPSSGRAPTPPSGSRAPSRATTRNTPQPIENIDSDDDIPF